MTLTDTEFCDHTVEVHLPAALTREVLQRVILAGVEVEAGAASVRMFVGYNVTSRDIEAPVHVAGPRDPEAGVGCSPRSNVLQVAGDDGLVGVGVQLIKQFRAATSVAKMSMEG